MHIRTRNVNTAFKKLVTLFNYSKDKLIIENESRNGPVRMLIEPITVTYSNPLERVLINSERDCNPFFHMYEALWMLAGRNDVKSLSYYTSKMSQYSDNGTTFNGAYGYRWYEPVNSDENQLDKIINHLRNNKESRRAVLQMWNVKDDLYKIDGKNMSKDVCCNLSVCFNIITKTTFCELCRHSQFDNTNCKQCKGLGKITKSSLDMTVFNRSNDLILGMLGANYVHFTFLQEYVAMAIGVEVGKYNQISNNLHVYTKLYKWNPIGWIKSNNTNYYNNEGYLCEANRIPLFENPSKRKEFDDELCQIVNNCNDTQHILDYVRDFKNKVIDISVSNKFLRQVALPMFISYAYYKEKNYGEAKTWCNLINQFDWWTAATVWLQKRIK